MRVRGGQESSPAWFHRPCPLRWSHVYPSHRPQNRHHEAARHEFVAVVLTNALLLDTVVALLWLRRWLIIGHGIPTLLLR
jgi:hypothetical protein